MLTSTVRLSGSSSSELLEAARRKKDRDLKALDHKAEIRRCGADAAGVCYWFDNYVWTYDPRRIGKRDDQGNRLSPYTPFKLWPRQVEMIHWLWDRVEADEEWLVEKSRDTGVSYLTVGFSLNRWLFEPGFKATFGSRKVDLVDLAGQPDSLFEKLRIMLSRLPEWMQPEGFRPKSHSLYMRLIHPVHGGTITGEGGEDMGRGGRSKIYLVDEAAKVPNAENVEKSLAGNTDCIGWVSTVNGMGNLFARKRHSVLAERQVFRFHYTADPRKTPEWAAAKKASLSDPSSWASEYDIDYHASTEDVCIPAAWVASAQKLAQLDPRATRSGQEFTIGLDVGAGKAKSVVIARRGQIVAPPRSRGNPDTTGTAHWAMDYARELQARLLNFDAPGVGAGVSGALINSDLAALRVQPINTGSDPFVAPEWDDGRTSEEQFRNLKAEIWWLARMAFKRTHEHVLWLEDQPAELGARMHPISDLIALPSGDIESDRLAAELSVVKYFKTTAGKIIMESKEQLAKRGVKSPDYADALVLTFIPYRGSAYTLQNL